MMIEFGQAKKKQSWAALWSDRSKAATESWNTCMLIFQKLIKEEKHET